MRFALVALAGLICSGAAHATSNWFTVSGHPDRADVDTVQVDPVSIDRDAGSRTMNIRVNRAQLRRNWDGIPYRSYSAQVRILCGEGRAEYLNIRLHIQPLWVGAYQDAAYADKRPPMVFRDARPNPTERILRAACSGP